MVSSYYPVFNVKEISFDNFANGDNLNLKAEHHFKNDNLEYLTIVDANGNHLDLFANGSAEQNQFFGMRMNVSDFEETLKDLEGRGFKVTMGPMDFPKFKFALMEIPDRPGVMRHLVYHHKKA